MAISKIILNGVTQMDLTQDTTDASKTLASYTGHGADGEAFTGSYVPSVPVLTTKTITANGTYNASSDSADGYSSVTVNVSWMGFRNTTSGTSGSQLYKNGTAVGTASTTFVNTYGQSVSLSSQSFTKDDVLVVRARSRNTSYVMGVGNLIIEEV